MVSNIEFLIFRLDELKRRKKVIQFKIEHYEKLCEMAKKQKLKTNTKHRSKKTNKSRQKTKG